MKIANFVRAATVLVECKIVNADLADVTSLNKPMDLRLIHMTTSMQTNELTTLLFLLLSKTR